MYYPSDDDTQWSDYHTCHWCGEPSDTDICATCQRRYEDAQACARVEAAPSLVEVIRAVTRRKQLGRV